MHDYQLAHGNPTHARPKVPRPPEVKRIWHNGFGEQLADVAAPAAAMLETTAETLSGAANPQVRQAAVFHRELADSVPEAIHLARRASPEQLDIPINPGFDAGVVVMGKPAVTRKVGSLTIRLLAPAQIDLDNLREDWRKWLRAHEAELEEIAREARADADSLGQSEVERLLAPLIQQADALGDRTKVTPPNLASIMFAVDEADVRILLTGDGHGDDLLAGLRARDMLSAGGGLHVQLLKVQHHGSENNITEAFCRAITANHYVFCGNGEHENPDLRVLRAIAASRIGGPAELSANPEAGQPFTFWFNSSSQVTRAEAVDHMRAVEAETATLVAASNGRLTVHFLTDDLFEIDPGA